MQRVYNLPSNPAGFRHYPRHLLSRYECADAINQLITSGSERIGREPRRANYISARDIVSDLVDGLPSTILIRCQCGSVHTANSRAWQLLHPSNLGAADIADSQSRSIARNYFPPREYMRVGCIDCPEQRN